MFLLNRLEGYSFPQIAAQLGISLSMVEKHAAKAVLFLADWMKVESGEAASPAAEQLRKDRP